MEASAATARARRSAALNERYVVLLMLVVEVVWLAGVGYGFSLIL